MSFAVSALWKRKLPPTRITDKVLFFSMDTNEQVISEFMQRHYSDERLAWLLAHTEDGLLSYNSCCCFIGIAVVSDEALCGAFCGCFPSPLAPVSRARLLLGGRDAEDAFRMLGAGDEKRRAKLIPLIRSEMARRESSRSQTEVNEVVMV